MATDTKQETRPRKPWYAEYQVDVPEGESGPWRVERFEVPQHSVERIRLAFDGRGCPPGWYTRLTRNGKVIMSDTPAEIGDHLYAIRRASGRVLIHGLGLGMVLRAVLAKDAVTHVDVLEQTIGAKRSGISREATWHRSDEPPFQGDLLACCARAETA